MESSLKSEQGEEPSLDPKGKGGLTKGTGGRGLRYMTGQKKNVKNEKRHAIRGNQRFIKKVRVGEEGGSEQAIARKICLGLRP